jgi:quercetin dioxygenase-like cupin family protein
MRNLKVLTILSLIVLGLSNVPMGVIASDSDPLQDFCIADLSAGAALVNGYPCKDPTLATTEDFAFSGLANAANLTGNPTNGTATFGFVREWPAVNTLGLGLARLDINPGGIIMPHTHNLATEILFCLEGEIYTGFVTNSDNPTVPNKLYAKVVKKGEAFIFPRGLLHFQLNKGNVPAVSLNVLNSQNAGIQLMPVSLFGTGIDPELLAKSFFISEKEVAGLASIFKQIAKVPV